MSVFFFFSSRRRHTRYWREWSSDVCSSDLEGTETARRGPQRASLSHPPAEVRVPPSGGLRGSQPLHPLSHHRTDGLHQEKGGRIATERDEFLRAAWRSEEHTSELQSRQYLV